MAPQLSTHGKPTAMATPETAAMMAAAMAMAEIRADDIRAIVQEEADGELTAKEIRLLLEERLGLPRDALLHRKHEITEVVKRTQFVITERLSWKENLATVIGFAVGAGLATWLIGAPEATLDYQPLQFNTQNVKLVVIALGGVVGGGLSIFLQSTFGFFAAWFLSRVKGVPVNSAEMNAYLFPHSTEGRRKQRRLRLGIDFNS